MARTFLLKRGTTAKNNSYVGAVGELTLDSTTGELRVHDGSIAGGTVVHNSAWFANNFYLKNGYTPGTVASKYYASKAGTILEPTNISVDAATNFGSQDTQTFIIANAAATVVETIPWLVTNTAGLVTSRGLASLTLSCTTR